MAPFVNCIENTASETTMTATSLIAPMAPMPGARLPGPRASRPAHDHDAGLEARGPARHEVTPAAQIAQIAQIPKRIENTASEAPGTDTSQIAQIAPISPDWRHLAQSFCKLGATEAQLAELFCVSPQTIAGWMAE